MIDGLYIAVIAAVFSFGMLLGHVFTSTSIRSDCEQMGQFRSGDTVYICNLKVRP